MVQRSTRKRHYGPLAVLLVGSLLLTLASVAWWRGSTPSPGNLLRTGFSAYERGDWELAARLAKQHLRTSAGDLDALRLLARASVRLGRDSSAISLFEQIGPPGMMSEDLYLLGVCLKRMGNRRGAEVWEEGRLADPDHPEILEGLAQTYFELDRFRDAADAATRLARNPKWQLRAWSLLGEIRFAQGDVADAAAWWGLLLEQPALNQVAESLPGNHRSVRELRKQRARALLRAERTVEARVELEKVLLEVPALEDAEASWLLSRAFLQEGRLDQALAALGQASGFGEERPTAPEPAVYVGATRCAECHAEKYHLQQSSRHARTFHRAADLTELAVPPPGFPDPAAVQVTHTLHQSQEGLEQETRVADRVYRAVVEYAFGSGDRGQTFVGRGEGGELFELRLSAYREGPECGWDVTTGHPLQPPDARGFLGVPLTMDALVRCLSCHVTDPQAVMGPTSGPLATDRSIGCEKCHGPGGNHLRAVAARFPDLAIARPSLAAGSRVVEVCARCHSPRGETVSADDPTSIRFQGTTLTWSRCYTESGDQLDCVTCHDPHRDVSTSAAHYESRCLSCHARRPLLPGLDAEARKEGSRTQGTAQTICPVSSEQGCVSCHMPLVQSRFSHSSFTDHFIRVHREPVSQGPR